MNEFEVDLSAEPVCEERSPSGLAGCELRAVPWVHMVFGGHCGRSDNGNLRYWDDRGEILVRTYDPHQN